MRRAAVMLLPIAALLLAACGVPLQSEPELLPSDLVPTSAHVATPSTSGSPAP